MKKRMWSKVAVITLALSLFATGVYAGTVIQSYKTVRGNTATVEREDVHKNRIALKVNGQNVSKSTWYANQTTYVPMRDVAEMLGAEVVYNSSTMTAEINTKTASNNEVKKINKVIVNDANVKATLVSIEKIVDKTWNEEKYEVKFEVENKRAQTVVFQAREVSANGKMIDESMLTMSQEVSSGKKADAILTIQNYNGSLPAITSDFEMLLHAFDWDSNFRADYKVKATF